jgi:hypothetical protein
VMGSLSGQNQCKWLAQANGASLPERRAASLRDR